MEPGRHVRSVSLILKFLIFFQSFAGLSLLIYSAWILDRWSRSLAPSWFGFGVLGVGFAVCAIAVIGHISAESLSRCCLCFYVVLAIALMFLETSLIVFLSLDTKWEEDLPRDSTGELKKLRAFIEANFDITIFIGLALVIVQVLSLFFAIFLRRLVLTLDKSNVHSTLTRQPILRPQCAPNTFPCSMDGKGIPSDV